MSVNLDHMTLSGPLRQHFTRTRRKQCALGSGCDVHVCCVKLHHEVRAEAPTWVFLQIVGPDNDPPDQIRNASSTVASGDKTYSDGLVLFGLEGSG